MCATKRARWHFAEMPRFFLHIFNGETTIDEEGIELPDAAAALAKARTVVREMAADSVRSEGHLVLSHRVFIEDGHRSEVGTVYFREVIAVEQ